MERGAASKRKAADGEKTNGYDRAKKAKFGDSGSSEKWKDSAKGKPANGKTWEKGLKP
jgi:hypothetical protein